MKYTVTWQIEVEAKSAKGAAIEAFALREDAPDFIVEDGLGKQKLVTLNERDRESRRRT